MEIILAHTNGDFDTLASMVAASKLYPQAYMVIPGSCERNVRDFLAEYPHNLQLKKSKHIKLEEINRLIIVDTRQPSRIGKFEKLIESGIPVTIYDHHPPLPGDIQVKDGIVKEIGATVTILLQMIREANIPISPIEATIFALGIYEDTGCLTFSTATSQDAEAVAYLISSHADINILNRFLEQGLNTDQILILSDLLRNQDVHYIQGVKVIITTALSERYIGDLSVLAHKMIDIEKLEVLFCLIALENRIYIIARSRADRIDISQILLAFGGGGHHLAASAAVKDMSLKEVKNKLLQLLYKQPFEYIPTILPQFKNIKHLMIERLPIEIQNLLNLIGQVGDSLKLSVYVVGGLVRDIFLGKGNFDIDVVVDGSTPLTGDGIKFAKKFAEMIGGYCESYERFKTAVVVFPNGFKLDIATARTESYEYPGALPDVFGSNISYDLIRRDFSINAMAICLNNEGNRYGQLIDFLGGEKDIQQGIIRVLHKNSFSDDPTRIFRAVRFESRYNFKMDEATEQLILKIGQENSLFAKIANQRMRDEFILILSDDYPQRAMLRLQDLGILKYVHPDIRINNETLMLFKSVSQTLLELEHIIRDGYRLQVTSYKAQVSSEAHEPIERWLVYLLAIIDGWTLSQTQEIMEHLRFNRLQRKNIFHCKTEAKKIISFLTRDTDIKKSMIFQILNKVPLETLIFVITKSQLVENEKQAERIKKRIILFLTELRHIHIEITSDDLKKAGFKQGSIFKEIFASVLAAKMDGLLKNKKDEIEFVKKSFLC